jgi:hypothetical protein
MRPRLNDAGDRLVCPAMSSQGTVGARAAVRAASEWNEGTARAVAVLRRPDAVKSEMNRRGTPLASLIGLPEALRRPPEGPSAHLPAWMLLLVDSADTVRLFEAKQKLHLHLGEELAAWPPGRAKMTVLPGRGNFRAIEIAYGGERLVVAAPWRGGGTQAALKLIEGATSLSRA